jgi:hypothetical protein
MSTSRSAESVGKTELRQVKIDKANHILMGHFKQGGIDQTGSEEINE